MTIENEINQLYFLITLAVKKSLNSLARSHSKQVVTKEYRS